MAIEIDVTDDAESGATVLKIDGDVDLESSPALHDHITRLLKSGKIVKVDLSGVGYMDSSGIAVLTQGLKLSQQKSGTFVLLNPSQQVQAVIDLALLTQLFTIEHTDS